jgi:MFS family permease
MGLLPTYTSWGLVSTGLMIALRLLQGFCLGGELPGSITYVVETVPRRAGFVCAFVFFCVNLGVLLGAGVNLAIHYILSPEEAALYGWRIAFAIGGAFGFLSFWLRRKLEETPEFSNLKHGAAKHPMKEVVGEHWRPLIAAVCVTASIATFNGLMFAHMPAYLEKVMRYDARYAALAENIGLIALSVSILFFGWLSDRVPRHKILRLGAALVLAGCYPFYVSLESHSVDLIWLLVFAGCVGGLASGTFASVIAEMFPTRVRFSGIGLSYNIGFTLFSGTVPWVATSLIRISDSAAAPAFIMAFCAALTLITTFLIRPSAGNILGEVSGQV